MGVKFGTEAWIFCMLPVLQQFSDAYSVSFCVVSSLVERRIKIYQHFNSCVFSAISSSILAVFTCFWRLPVPSQASLGSTTGPQVGNSKTSLLLPIPVITLQVKNAPTQPSHSKHNAFSIHSITMSPKLQDDCSHCKNIW